MDDVSRTHTAYEADSEAYVEKYTAESVARQYGGPFLERLNAVESPRVLDIGCGPGPDVETFTAEGYDVTGFDVTRSFLQEGVRRVPSATFVRGDMRSLPLRDDSFDGIWSSASFHHVPRTDALETLQDCRRVLDDGGSMFVAVKRDPQLDDDDTDRYFEYYGREEFRSLLDSAGFELQRVTTEGKWVTAVVTH